MQPDVSIKAFYGYLLGIKSKETAKKYAYCARSFVRLMQSSGYQTFAQIPSGLLGDFASTLRKNGLGASSTRVQVFGVKRYLEWVGGRGVEVAKQARVDLPRVEIRMRPVLPPELLTQFFRQADLDLEEPMRTAVMLLPCCGLRAKEIVNLRLADIHRARVKLKNGKQKKTLFLNVRGKGDKERNVPLMEEGVEILTGYLAGWRKRQPGPWIFPKVTADKKTSGKEAVSDRHLRGSLYRLCEPLGMSFTPHTMRRTYITTLYRKGIDLRTLASIAGHSNMQTTVDHYISMDPTDSVRALHDVGSSLTN
jgi:site-specific recombinase XerD